MAKENFTYRISSDLKRELEALAAKCGEVEGRRVTVSEVLTRCIESGKPLVEKDNSIAITLPRTASSEKEKILHVAMQVIEKGLEQLQPGAAQ